LRFGGGVARGGSVGARFFSGGSSGFRRISGYLGVLPGRFCGLSHVLELLSDRLRNTTKTLGSLAV
jgi:hypothetical protein